MLLECSPLRNPSLGKLVSCFRCFIKGQQDAKDAIRLLCLAEHSWSPAGNLQRRSLSPACPASDVLPQHANTGSHVMVEGSLDYRIFLPKEGPQIKRVGHSLTWPANLSSPPSWHQPGYEAPRAKLLLGSSYGALRRGCSRIWVAPDFFVGLLRRGFAAAR